MAKNNNKKKNSNSTLSASDRRSIRACKITARVRKSVLQTLHELRAGSYA
jgi:hypothetical protein